MTIRPRHRAFVLALLVSIGALMLLAPGASAAPGSASTFGWSFFKSASFEEDLDLAGYEPMKGMITTGGILLVPVAEKVSAGIGFATSYGWSKSEERSACLELGYGGIAIEYGRNVGDKVHLGVGGIVGLGTAALSTKQGTITDFGELLDASNSAAAWRPYVVVQPMASIGFAASPLVNVTISGGYTFMWSPIGWIDGFNFRDHFEGPLKTIGMPFVQLGIAFSTAGLPQTQEARY
jgi:hypothetical protein